MRSAWLASLLPMFVACGPDPGPDNNLQVYPDAVPYNCDASSFQFVAPRPELHYATDLIAITDFGSFYATYGQPGLVAVDDLGHGYEPIGTPTSAPLGNGEVEMRWSFQLAPSHRYTLYFSATECDQTVEFFTSAP
jgi:hypothetical protein